MKKVILILFLIHIPILAHAQDSLELDYIRTSPSKAFMYSAVVPGGGYYHLSSVSYNSKYERKGVIFSLLGLGSYFLLATQIKNKDSFAPVLAGAAVLGIRIIEFSSVIDDAEHERYQAMQKNRPQSVSQ